MYLIRGIRSLSSGYAHDFINIPETEENVKSHVALETEDNECTYVKFSATWPSKIVLDAQMIPSKIPSAGIFAERYENDVSLGKNFLYTSPIIHQKSGITSPRAFCSKITIKFEGSGEYSFCGEHKSFFDDSFDEYKINIENDVLFEKDFLVLNAPIIEKLTRKIGEHPTIDETNERVPYRVYPYGGFYEFGAHPQEIESCVFQISSEESKSSIKLWKLGAFFVKYGADPTINSIVDDGNNFIGIENFSASQKMTLYDELKNGSCKILLENTVTKEIHEYKSAGIYHRLNTSLVRINFRAD
jgi:hypothetical protein